LFGPKSFFVVFPNMGCKTCFFYVFPNMGCKPCQFMLNLAKTRYALPTHQYVMYNLWNATRDCPKCWSHHSTSHEPIVGERSGNPRTTGGYFQ
jgi:hypothetical protein